MAVMMRMLPGSGTAGPIPRQLDATQILLDMVAARS
jgi:hypothetical protein